MPCYDGREEEDRKEAKMLGDAKTALLCGVLNRDPASLALARRWHEHHKIIDERRRLVKYDWQDTEIGRQQRQCDAVLHEVHRLLCATDGIEEGR